MRCYFATSRSRHHGWRTLPRLLYHGCILLLVTNGLSQESKSGQLPSQQVPKSATIEIVLLKAPGIDDEGSRWEIAYEFRLSNEAAIFEAHKQEKSQGAEVRVGELIKEADGKKSLRPPENHKFVFEIPFSPEIQERLRTQPKDMVKPPPGAITPEVIKQLREQEMKSQVLLFYSVINIYDARLKKNIMIPIPTSWTLAKYPNARFEIRIEVNSDGSYSWNRSSPANTSSPILEIRKP